MSNNLTTMTAANTEHRPTMATTMTTTTLSTDILAQLSDLKQFSHYRSQFPRTTNEDDKYVCVQVLCPPPTGRNMMTFPVQQQQQQQQQKQQTSLVHATIRTSLINIMSRHMRAGRRWWRRQQRKGEEGEKRRFESGPLRAEHTTAPRESAKCLSMTIYSATTTRHQHQHGGGQQKLSCCFFCGRKRFSEGVSV